MNFLLLWNKIERLLLFLMSYYSIMGTWPCHLRTLIYCIRFSLWGFFVLKISLPQYFHSIIVYIIPPSCLMCSYETPALIVICNFLPMLGHYSIFIRMYKASKLVLCNTWKHESRTFLQIVKQSDVFCKAHVAASEMQKMSYSCTYIQ